MTNKLITSVQNPIVKDVLLLQQKSSERRARHLFAVEGQRELQHCMAAGFRLQTLFVCRDLCQTDTQAFENNAAETVEVSLKVYEKMAYRGTTEGLLATVCERRLTFEDLHLPQHPLIVVLEGVEKPGNLGAILRSADAAKVDAVIVCDPLTDLYNPNLIRSSIGAVFTIPVISCDSKDCIKFLQQHGIQILTAQLQDSKFYYETDMTCGTAIVMGTESTGLTQQWREAASAHIKIPMLGQLDSLNVSVSAAILMFEAVRQRMQKQ